ncbi:diacylglycerol/lipid kinase family protein [Vagococcus carniphilus]|uniref:DAGKc domain-containing protein n=1 Tax=Vagococcus carniphilus TaxID=218144 RepID=A0A430B7H2_9ENTE|nr:YegS/Rv2252/BmrU family lipid kinase [Vagococcus carniphilus]QNN72319.1 YegS/Rv2252/BmrU family lipid kinase [Vagococcus carniphilus]RSU16233.1 hypothetical protein CBF28_04660 [Vagococcus carniphilus]
MELYGIFYNANAGDGKSEETAKYVKNMLKDNQIDSIFLTAKNAKEAVTMIKESMKTIDGLIAIGGDGTLNIVGTAFIQSSKTVPLGIIPGGTINNFAKRWKIPLAKEEAMKVILERNTKKISIGECNNEAIISSFTFGRLADLSNDVRQSEKRKYGLIVYPYKALKHLGSKTSYLVKYKTEDKEYLLKTWVALATTTSFVGGIPYTSHDKNAFHVSILNNISFSKIKAYLTYAFTGNLKGKKAITYLAAETLKLENVDKTVSIQTRIDGDPGPDLPLTLNWKKDFLDVAVPK